MKYKKLLLLPLLLISLSSCVVSKPDVSSSSEIESSDTNSSSSTTTTSEDTSSSSSSTSLDEIEYYYKDVDTSKNGMEFLKELQILNRKEKTFEDGYKNMGKYFLKTDGDPENPNNLIGFYSGESKPFNGSWTTFNREHVWPNSRGGGSVEDDIHVIRPTIQAQNGSRGNAFFVEGNKSQSSGWDPAMESWGDEKYRGITARIVFYCVVANSNFRLVDTNNDSTSAKTMGKLSDLIKWNEEYPIDWTEIQRNEAAEDIQGNRNPFIDHPEWVEKIWGNL